MKPGVTYDLVHQLAKALNAEGQPPIKDGIAYRILAFKPKDNDVWAVAMIPLEIADPSTLFDHVNKAYGQFLENGESWNGILFFQNAEPDQLIETVTQWYNEGADQPPITQSRFTRN